MEFKVFIEIIRFYNCLFVGIVGVLGLIVVVGGFLELKIVIFVFLVVFFGCVGGNIINDYFDYEIDKINRFERLFLRGVMSRKVVFWYLVVFFVIGIVFVWFINIWDFLLVIVVYVIMFIYVWKLKLMFFIGNVVVVFLIGVIFFYGVIVVGEIGFVGMFVLCVFFVNVVREVIKDIEDIEGDMVKGVKIFFIFIGRKRVVYVGVLFVILIVVVFFLFIKVGIGFGYFVMFFVDVVILYFVFFILRF